MIGSTLAIQTILNGLVFHNQDLYVGIKTIFVEFSLPLARSH